jgi:hypothetical protein
LLGSAGPATRKHIVRQNRNRPLCHIGLMNAKEFATVLAGGLAVGAFAVAVPAPASAEYDYAGYINALQDAGLMASPYGDGGYGHQFPTESSALYTGMSVCRSVQEGRAQSAIVDGLSSGEGMLMNASDAVIIYNAANTFLC